jgi:hypothetical protein
VAAISGLAFLIDDGNVAVIVFGLMIGTTLRLLDLIWTIIGFRLDRTTLPLGSMTHQVQDYDGDQGGGDQDRQILNPIDKITKIKHRACPLT